MDPSANTTIGLIGYAELNLSVDAEDRALFMYPPFKSTKEIEQKLHNFRIANDIVKGPEGLDVQGFTLVSHPLSLDQDRLCAGTNVEDIYVPEIENLIREVTGAKRAVVDNIAFRRGLPEDSHDHLYQQYPRGGEVDTALAQLPSNNFRVFGRTMTTMVAPYRFAHIDYTIPGLRQTVRWARKDVAEAAASALAAEDDGKISRYACYSVWRPLKTVKRDPLAVLDWRSLDTADVVPFKCRALSGVNEKGEYLRETGMGAPPRRPLSQRWYWIPAQTPDEVLVIKFADTGALEDSSIAGHCLHCSPAIEGTENEDARISVECRVFAFWE